VLSKSTPVTARLRLCRKAKEYVCVKRHARLQHGWWNCQTGEGVDMHP
jgi:hypothetical protein